MMSVRLERTSQHQIKIMITHSHERRAACDGLGAQPGIICLFDVGSARFAFDPFRSLARRVRVQHKTIACKYFISLSLRRASSAITSALVEGSTSEHAGNETSTLLFADVKWRAWNLAHSRGAPCIIATLNANQVARTIWSVPNSSFPLRGWVMGRQFVWSLARDTFYAACTRPISLSRRATAFDVQKYFN